MDSVNTVNNGRNFLSISQLALLQALGIKNGG